MGLNTVMFFMATNRLWGLVAKNIRKKPFEFGIQKKREIRLSTQNYYLNLALTALNMIF